MNIDKKLYEQFPNLSDTFNEISGTIIGLKLCRIEKIYPSQIGKPLTPRTVFRFQVYLQVVLNRIIELSESIVVCINNQNTASAFILLRAMYENASVIFDAYLRLADLIVKNDFQKTYELIFNLQYGTRLKNEIEKISVEQSEKNSDLYYTKEKIKEVYTSQQILSVMDRVSKIIPKH